MESKDAYHNRISEASDIYMIAYTLRSLTGTNKHADKLCDEYTAKAIIEMLSISDEFEMEYQDVVEDVKKYGGMLSTIS